MDLTPCPTCGTPPSRVVQTEYLEVEGDAYVLKCRKHFVVRCGTPGCPDRHAAGASGAWRTEAVDDLPKDAPLPNLPEDEEARRSAGEAWNRYAARPATPA